MIQLIIIFEFFFAGEVTKCSLPVTKGNL